MASYAGYNWDVYERDKFVCQYCGFDGKESLSNWLLLSIDHLLPEGHPKRNDNEYQTVACRYCNEADNRYFAKLKQRELSVEGKTRQQLIDQRSKYVQESRTQYESDWKSRVAIKK